MDTQTLGALENLKMGQVIHKIGHSKLYAAIFEFFIFWPVRANFRANWGKFCQKRPKISNFQKSKNNFFLVLLYSYEVFIEVNFQENSQSCAKINGSEK